MKAGLSGSVGLADLVQALARDEPARAKRSARLLGFEPRAIKEKPISDPPPLHLQSPETDDSQEPEAQEAGRPKPIPFWRPVRVEAAEEIRETLERAPAGRSVRPLTRADLEREPLPAKTPIVPWSRLWPALLPILRGVLQRDEIDTDELIERWSSGEVMDELPTRKSTASTSRLVVVVDRARKLMPLWGDQDLFIAELRRRLGEASVRVIDARWARLGWPQGRHKPPNAGDVVLALTDLGAFGPPSRQRAWLGLGRQLRRFGLEPAALCLCPLDRWCGAAFGIWRTISWSQPLSAGKAIASMPPDGWLQERAERLLRLLAPAEWVEPGLLREARLLLPAGEADFGTEVDAWNHRQVDGSSWIAMSLHASVAEKWRGAFDREPEHLRTGIVEALRIWHAGSARETWVVEAQRLLASGSVTSGLISEAEEEQLVEFIERAGRLGDLNESLASSTRRWVRFNAGELPPSVWSDARLGPVWRRAWLASQPSPEDSSDHLPPGVIPPPIEGAPLRWLVVQHASHLHFHAESPAGHEGSPLASIAAKGPRITVASSHDAWARRYDLEPGLRVPLPLPNPRPGWSPNWAARAGEDHFGRWADLKVGRAVQRFRFIHPGTFRMGSPANEQGRFDHEGPRHRVTLTQSFWLADTPCTQELWQEVMSKNPSRFQSLKRPVEQVSWDETQRFFELLEAHSPGFSGRLPREAEWEYACRAGTSASSYAGELKILGDHNAPMLDSIAWYGGNSGHGFELAQGFDSSGSDDKQYPHEKTGSREVATRQPNPWGLFDMLGNVDEWCLDWYGEYGSGDAIDPEGPEMGASRVYRGGSWFDGARNVRAAARDWWPPEHRNSSLGFRLSRGQAPEEAAEPQQDGPVDGGEPGEGRAGGPQASRIVLLASDVERVELQAFERPDWAVAAGRDQYGLWASFEVEGIEQCLRWIPPGGFLMGSPEDEAGRSESEGPQHLVILTSGYWLGDVPCTQELWQAVTGENPSEFQSPKRPVEQVDWVECQSFCDRLGAMVDGLRPRLPSEAEWEYACRAGTKTATYRGDFEILGANNAPLLDDIAWYGGNSGHGFELKNGRDSAGWPGRQYPHAKAGSREVRAKTPNPWGLYDMLGNVLEWCSDWYGPYSEEAIRDPQGPEMGTYRVYRGGSWLDNARYVRAAARGRWLPEFRFSSLGFRLSRGQASAGPVESEGRPVGPAAEPGEGRAGGTDEDDWPATEERRR